MAAMHQATTTHHADDLKAGSELVCEKCGMAMQVTADCGCESGVHLECCGQPLTAHSAPTPPPPGQANMS